jgi:hypothetical protein
MLSSTWSQFKFNLPLQIFDGLFTYYVLTLGIPEANPFVRGAISSWGPVGGLVYSKLFACAMLGIIFALRHLTQRLTLQALTLTSTYLRHIPVPVSLALWRLTNFSAVAQLR